MFSIADIRDIAIQIEKNGEKAYRLASREASDPKIANIFSLMADEEKRHGQWFGSIDSEKQLSREQQELEEMGRGLLKEMIADQTFSMEDKELRKVKTFQEMVVQSKSFEKDTILFYQFIKGVLDNDEACRQIDLIIAEEQNHFDRLTEMEEAGDDMFASVSKTI